MKWTKTELQTRTKRTWKEIYVNDLNVI